LEPTGGSEYDHYLYGGTGYGGTGYGGTGYGGTYANYNPYEVLAGASSRRSTYVEIPVVDAGAIAGRVTWADRPAGPRIMSPCGDVNNPSLLLGPHGEATGAVVYLEAVAFGRGLPTGTTLTGGTIERTACSLAPTAQVLSPAPGTIIVYNDDPREVGIERRAKLDPLTVRLAAGGFQRVAIDLGVTSIADVSGELAPAWIVALDHPYHALTNELGQFRINGVVPGTYTLVVWHPPIITGWRGGKPVYGAPIVATRKIQVPRNSTAKVDVALK